MKVRNTATTTVREWTRVAGALLALALAGCSGLRSRDTQTVSYLLRAPAVAAPAVVAAATAAGSVGPQAAGGMAAAGPLAATSLQVLRVVAQPGYGSDRILLLGDDRSLGYFAASRWVDALPAVVGTLAVETLRGSGALRAVHDEFAPFAADHTLRLTIRRFEAEYPAKGQPPRITVSFECALGRRPDRTAVTGFVVQAQVDAADERMRDVVAAFEQATQQALGEAVRRALDALAADLATAAGQP